MSDDVTIRVFEKLDSIDTKCNETNISIAKLTATSKEYNTKCDRTHSAVFGNGSIGLRAKMWVVWGLLVAGGSILTGIIIVWVKSSISGTS